MQKRKVVTVGLIACLLAPELLLTIAAGVETGGTLLAAGKSRPDRLPKNAGAKLHKRGRILARTRCGGCHRFYSPGEYSPAEWAPLAWRMGKKARLRNRDVEALTAYLKVASRAAREEAPAKDRASPPRRDSKRSLAAGKARSDRLPKNAGPELHKRGRFLSRTKCSGCHRFYSPREYSPSEWVPLARQMGKKARLRNRDIKALTAYLKTASRAARKKTPAGSLEVAAAKAGGTSLAPEELVRHDRFTKDAGPELIKRGRFLDRTKCSSCHRYYSSREYSPREWVSLARRMGKKARLRKRDIKALTAYLVTASRAALRKTAPDKSAGERQAETTMLPPVRAGE